MMFDGVIPFRVSEKAKGAVTMVLNGGCGRKGSVDRFWSLIGRHTPTPANARKSRAQAKPRDWDREVCKASTVLFRGVEER